MDQVQRGRQQRASVRFPHGELHPHHRYTPSPLLPLLSVGACVGWCVGVGVCACVCVCVPVFCSCSSCPCLPTLFCFLFLIVCRSLFFASDTLLFIWFSLSSPNINRKRGGLRLARAATRCRRGPGPDSGTAVPHFSSPEGCSKNHLICLKSHFLSSVIRVLLGEGGGYSLPKSPIFISL